MTPRELLATAQIPGGDEMRLYRRGEDHMILLERTELMSTRMSGSEEALATLTAQRLGAKPKQRWLVGMVGQTGQGGLAALPVVAGLEAGARLAGLVVHRMALSGAGCMGLA